MCLIFFFLFSFWVYYLHVDGEESRIVFGRGDLFAPTEMENSALASESKIFAYEPDGTIQPGLA